MALRRSSARNKPWRIKPVLQHSKGARESSACVAQTDQRSRSTTTRGVHIPKYNEKTEADLAWDAIRREIEYRLNFWAANEKARKKNEILPKLQSQFEEALNEGVILQLEPGDTSWLNDQLEVASGA